MNRRLDSVVWRGAAARVTENHEAHASQFNAMCPDSQMVGAYPTVTSNGCGTLAMAVGSWQMRTGCIKCLLRRRLFLWGSVRPWIIFRLFLTQPIGLAFDCSSIRQTSGTENKPHVTRAWAHISTRPAFLWEV